jgi:hypothetical protein
LKLKAIDLLLKNFLIVRTSEDKDRAKARDPSTGGKI